MQHSQWNTEQLSSGPRKGNDNPSGVAKQCNVQGGAGRLENGSSQGRAPLLEKYSIESSVLAMS